MDNDEKVYPSDWLRSEQPNYMSRKIVTIKSGAGKLKSSTVLGKIALAAAAAVAFAINAGSTGTIGAITVGAGAKVGDYKVVIIEPGSNAGKFFVEDPDGETVGTGTVGVAFSGGGLGFTVADGATDFLSGEGFTITVAAGSGKYVQPTDSATDGSGVGSAILLHEVDATDADADGLVIYRDAQVASSELIYHSSVTTDNEKGVVNAGLLEENIQFLASA